MDYDIVTLEYDRIIDAAETDKAYLFVFGGEDVWIPKSQVEDIRETVLEVDIPRWLMDADDLEEFERRDY